MQSNFKPFPPQEVDVDDEDIFVHPEFKSLRTLRNNIAVLRLNPPGVELGLYPTISSICLPCMYKFLYLKIKNFNFNFKHIHWQICVAG